MATYAEKLKKPAWQKRRLKVLERDNWTCQLCKSTERTLNVHHLKYSREPHEAPDEDLITYCEVCHLITETLKKHNEKVERVSIFDIAQGFGFAIKTDKNVLLGNVNKDMIGSIDIKMGFDRVRFVVDALNKVSGNG